MSAWKWTIDSMYGEIMVLEDECLTNTGGHVRLLPDYLSIYAEWEIQWRKTYHWRTFWKGRGLYRYPDPAEAAQLAMEYCVAEAAAQVEGSADAH